MESPKATTVPAEVRLCTSMAFSHHIDVVVAPNGSPISSAVTSPAPSALRWEVVNAPRCRLGRTPAPGTCRLTAKSCPARTAIRTGSLVTRSPGAIVTDALPPNRTGWFEPGASRAPRIRCPTAAAPISRGSAP